MKNVITVDDLIAFLETVKREKGGNTKVVVSHIGSQGTFYADEMDMTVRDGYICAEISGGKRA
jgi:hypothetical protein